MMMARLSLSANGSLLERPSASRRRRAPSRSARSTSPAMAQDRPAARRCSVSRSTIAVGDRVVACRSARDVARRRAARFARDRRVEHHRRHAGGQRLERRQARSLRIRTGTQTPTRARYSAASVASSTYERMLMRSACVRAPRESRRDRAADDASGSRRRSRAARPGPVARHAIERLDQSIDPPPLEYRADDTSTIGAVRSLRTVAAGRDCVDARAESRGRRAWHADVARDLGFENSRVGDDRRARGAPTTP